MARSDSVVLKADGSPCDSRHSDAAIGISKIVDSFCPSGWVKDKLKHFERMNRKGALDNTEKGTVLRQKVQRPHPRVSVLVSEKKVRELESALRHREEVIRSLEGAIARRESDLSLVLKEKFQLSKEIVASRSGLQSCALKTQCAQCVSSTDAPADSAGDDDLSAIHCSSAKCKSVHLSLRVNETKAGKDCATNLVEEDRQKGRLQYAKEAPDCEVPQAPAALDALQTCKKEQIDKNQHLRHLLLQEQASFAHGGEIPANLQQDTDLLLNIPRVKQDSAVENSMSSVSHLHTPPLTGKGEPHRSAVCSSAPTADLSSCCPDAPTTHVAAESPSIQRTKSALADAEAYLTSNRWRLKGLELKKTATANDSSRVQDGQEAEGVFHNVVSMESDISHAHEPAGEVEKTGRIDESLSAGVDAEDLADMHNTTKFQADLFFKALLVQTQARIDAEAETFDILAMHEELSSKIDSLQTAFEEICEELEAVRKENKLLVQMASVNGAHKLSAFELPEPPRASSDEEISGYIGEFCKSIPPPATITGSNFTEELHSSGECGDQDFNRVSQHIELQCEKSSVDFKGHTKEQMRKTLRRMEKRLHEATMDRRMIEDSKHRSDAALLVAQKELKEAQRQLAVMEHRCKLLQDIDSRTWRMLETLILASGEHGGATSIDAASRKSEST